MIFVGGSSVYVFEQANSAGTPEAFSLCPSTSNSGSGFLLMVTNPSSSQHQIGFSGIHGTDQKCQQEEKWQEKSHFYDGKGEICWLI